MKLKWFGTASVMYQEGKDKILFDPFFPLNKKLYQPSLAEYAEVEHIFITHGHFDHLIDVPEILSKGKATVYCSEIVANILQQDGVESDRIVILNPGHSIETGPFTINAVKGRHIVFDKWMLFKTFCNYRMLVHHANLRKMLKVSSKFQEGGQTLLYQIKTRDKHVLHLGSLNLPEDQVYPKNMDMLLIPLQGRSDLNNYTMPYIKLLEPKTVLLHHFDDSFPPVSSTVDTKGFSKKLKECFPEVELIVPRHGEVVTI